MVIPLDVSGKEVRQPEHQQVDPAILPPSSLLVSQALSYLSRHWRNFVSSFFSFDSHFRQLLGDGSDFHSPCFLHVESIQTFQHADRTEQKRRTACGALFWFVLDVTAFLHHPTPTTVQQQDDDPSCLGNLLLESIVCF